MLKKMLSFLLAVVLVVGMIPAIHVHAEEAEETVAEETVTAEETTPVEETSAPTEEAAEATEAATEAEEETSAPAEETEAATEEVTEAATEEVTEAAQETSAAVEATVKVETVEVDYSAAVTNEETFLWNVEGGVLTISGSGAIPSYQTAEETPWYSQKDTITAVRVEKGITGIGDRAFAELTALKTAVISSDVSVMGSDIFFGCSALENLTIPFVGGNLDASTDAYWLPLGHLFGEEHYEGGDSAMQAYYVPSTGNKAYGIFSIPVSLRKVTVLGGGINRAAFSNCEYLTEIVLPEGATRIGEEAFYNCISLTGIEIPKTVTEIGESAFQSCEKLERIVMPDALTEIGRSAFGYCEKLENIVVPSGITKIPQAAFSYCRSLKSITLPKGLKEIGSSAFMHTALESIQLPEGLETIGGGAFFRSGLISLTLPDSVTDLANNAFGEMEQLRVVNLGSGITAISGELLRGCSELVSVSFGAGVTRIDGSAINSDKLQHVFYGGTEEQREAIAFDNVYSKVPTVKWEYEATGEELEVYEKTTCTTKAMYHCNICDGELYDHSYVGSHVYENGFCTVCNADERYSYTVDVDGIVITGYTGTDAELTIPEQFEGIPVGVIGSMAFFENQNLTKVNLPSGLKKLENNAFNCCDNLTMIQIPDGVTEIEFRAFFYSGVRAAVLPSSLKTLGSGVFPFGLQHVLYKGTESQRAAMSVEAENNGGLMENATWHYQARGDELVSVNTTTCGQKDFYRCTLCDAVIREYRYDADHDYTNTKWEIVQAPTCTEYGQKVGACTRCGYKTTQWMELEHKEVTATVTPPTCISFGYTTYTCTACGAQYTGDYKDPLPSHEYEQTVIDPTYTAPGYTEHRCKYCGDTYTSDYTDPLKPAVKPGKATGVSGKADVTSGKPKITWKAAKNAEYYNIYRSTSSSKVGSIIGNTVTTSFVDTAAAPGKTYYYRVEAVNGATAGDKTAAVKAVCKCASPVVTATNVESTGCEKLTWNKVTGASKYEVYRATSKSGKYTRLTSTKNTYYTDTGATVGTTYYYKVKAIASSSAYNSGDSAVISAKRACAQPALTAKTATSGKPSLSWKKITGAKEYWIYRAVKDNATGEFGTYKKVKTTTSTSYTDTNAAVGQTYGYYLIAVGKSSNNSVASKAVKASAVCAKPTISSVTADGATGNPVVKWKGVKDAFWYRVYRSTKSGSGYQLIGGIFADDGCKFQDTTATAGKKYYYKVQAVDYNLTAGVLSGNASGYADCAQPIVEATLTSKKKPKLTWEKVAGASKYEIYRSTKSGSGFKKIKTATSKTTSYTDTAATTGKTYYYKIKAIASNSSANSIYSKVLKVTKTMQANAISGTWSLMGIALSGDDGVVLDKVTLRFDANGRVFFGATYYMQIPSHQQKAVLESGVIDDGEGGYLYCNDLTQHKGKYYCSMMNGCGVSGTYTENGDTVVVTVRAEQEGTMTLKKVFPGKYQVVSITGEMYDELVTNAIRDAGAFTLRK